MIVNLSVNRGLQFVGYGHYDRRLCVLSVASYDGHSICTITKINNYK